MNINHMTQLPMYNELKNDSSIEIYEEMIKEIKEIQEMPVTPKKKVG